MEKISGLFCFVGTDLKLHSGSGLKVKAIDFDLVSLFPGDTWKGRQWPSG